MAFSDQTQFPRGRKVVVGLTSTPVTLFPAGAAAGVKITHLIMNSGTIGDRLVTFRGVNNGPVVMTLNSNDEHSTLLPGWQVDSNGLEVLTDSATADVGIFVFTVEPTIA